MSGFAFSHQFSKRWLATLPCQTRHYSRARWYHYLAFPDTDLDGYQFSVPNLHDKVEELLAIERERKKITSASTWARAWTTTPRTKRLEQHRLEQERLENKRLEIERLEKERLEQQRLEQQRLEQIQLTHRKRKRTSRRTSTTRTPSTRWRSHCATGARTRHCQTSASSKTGKPCKTSDATINWLNWGVANHQLDEQAQSTDTATSDVTIERHRSEMVYAIDHTDTADNTDNFCWAVLMTQQRQWWPMKRALLTHLLILTTHLSPPRRYWTNQTRYRQTAARLYRQLFALNQWRWWMRILNQWLKTEVEKQLTVRLSVIKAIKQALD